MNPHYPITWHLHGINESLKGIKQNLTIVSGSMPPKTFDYFITSFSDLKNLQSVQVQNNQFALVIDMDNSWDTFIYRAYTVASGSYIDVLPAAVYSNDSQIQWSLISFMYTYNQSSDIPGPTADATNGFYVGNFTLYQGNNDYYLCLDSTPGNAKWINLSDVITNTQFITSSGNIVNQIPNTDNFITSSVLTTTSGDIVSQITASSKPIQVFHFSFDNTTTNQTLLTLASNYVIDSMSVDVTSAAGTSAGYINVGIGSQAAAYISSDNVDFTIAALHHVSFDSPVSFYSGISPLPILFANVPGGQTYMGKLTIYYYAT